MTKLALFDFGSPERREGRTSKAFRLVWALFCWTLAFSAVVVAAAAFFRWSRMV